MTEKKAVQAEGSEDALDRALVGALAKFAAVEPRAGLEGRILANLSAQPVTSNRAWWAWGVAAALAAIMLVAIAITWRGRMTTPVVVEQKPALVQTPQPITTVAANHEPERVVLIHKAVKRVQVPANPKLDVFPSPRPLSEQEKMLASYVGQFQHEAVLVARARSEMELRDREREMRLTTGDQDSDASSPSNNTTMSGTTKR